jgi:prepilin-type N-terminal cleavage/methylation domain-containing protein
MFCLYGLLIPIRVLHNGLSPHASPLKSVSNTCFMHSWAIIYSLFQRVKGTTIRRFTKKTPLQLACHWSAFTLVELLVVLSVLGIITAFTIPKLLYTGQNKAYKSIYLETESVLSQAFQQAQQVSPVINASSALNLIPYINSVQIYSSGYIDAGSFSWDCSWGQCLKLQSGAVIAMTNDSTLGATTPNHFYTIIFDPDGKVSTPDNSYCIDVYANGRVASPLGRTALSVTYYLGAPASWSTWQPPPPDWYY